jgi:photosystem II stability/assembly factor-like uncharacterized protein
VQQQDYRQVSPTDIEPSPTYASDHTVLMIGPNHQCGMQVCAQIYRSSDGGATWSFLTEQAVTGVQLLLPTGSFDSGHFYAAGPSGVEATRDNGLTFTAVLPNTSGTAMVPPASSGLDTVYSGYNALWGIPRQGPAALLSAFDGGDNASGTPLLLNTTTGYVVLQPVSPPTSMPGTPTYLERCSPQCGPDTPLPLRETHPRFVASPSVATDHTVYEMGGSQLGVSHDDGLTFTVVSTPSVVDMIAVPGPTGRRLVAAIGDAEVLGYSDDDGTTWHMAAGPDAALTNAQTLTQLRPGRLIASMMRSDDWGWHYFVCSRDGATWTACSPDSG